MPRFVACRSWAKPEGLSAGRAASLVWKDAAAKNGSAIYMTTAAASIPRYVATLRGANTSSSTRRRPFNSLPRSAGRSPPSISSPTTRFLDTRLYKEWARPQGLVDIICTVLDKSATSDAMFGVFRHERDGVADDGARRRHAADCAAYAPRGADRPGNRLKTAEAATFADTLDGLSAGMFLVDARGRIVHANARGHRHAGRRRRAAAASGLLACGRPRCGPGIARRVPCRRQRRRGGRHQGRRRAAIARDGERYVAHVLPLTSGARRRAGTATRPSPRCSCTRRHWTRLAARGHRQDLQADAERAARAARPSSRSAACPRRRRRSGIAETTVKTHLQSPLRQDRHQPTGRPRQAGRRFPTPLVGVSQCERTSNSPSSSATSTMRPSTPRCGRRA